jgi:hypothetical protein
VYGFLLPDAELDTYRGFAEKYNKDYASKREKWNAILNNQKGESNTQRCLANELNLSK